MTLRVGNDNKLYYNTGTNAAPTWVLIEIVGDVTLNQGVNEAEVDLRLLDYIVNLPAKKTTGVTAALANHFGNTVYDAIKTIFENKTHTQYAISDIAIATSGAEYFKLFAFASSWDWSQATQQLSAHDVTLSPAYQEEAAAVVPPAWATTP